MQLGSRKDRGWMQRAGKVGTRQAGRKGGCRDMRDARSAPAMHAASSNTASCAIREARPEEAHTSPGLIPRSILCARHHACNVQLSARAAERRSAQPSRDGRPEKFVRSGYGPRWNLALDTRSFFTHLIIPFVVIFFFLSGGLSFSDSFHQSGSLTYTSNCSRAGKDAREEFKWGFSPRRDPNYGRFSIKEIIHTVGRMFDSGR